MWNSGHKTCIIRLEWNVYWSWSNCHWCGGDITRLLVILICSGAWVCLNEPRLLQVYCFWIAIHQFCFVFAAWLLRSTLVADRRKVKQRRSSHQLSIPRHWASSTNFSRLKIHGPWLIKIGTFIRNAVRTCGTCRQCMTVWKTYLIDVGNIVCSFTAVVWKYKPARCNEVLPYNRKKTRLNDATYVISD